MLDDCLLDHEAVAEGSDNSLGYLILFDEVDGGVRDVAEVVDHGFELLPLAVVVRNVHLVL